MPEYSTTTEGPFFPEDNEELARKRAVRRPDRDPIPEPEPPVAEPITTYQSGPFSERPVPVPVRPPGTQTLEEAQTRADFARRRNDAIKYRQEAGQEEPSGAENLFGRLAGQQPPPREKVDPSSLAGGKSPDADVPSESPAASTPKAKPQGGGGGGGYSASASFEGLIGGDYNEQIAAMEREKAARGNAADVESQALGDVAEQKRGYALESQAQAKSMADEGRARLADIEKLTHAYADDKVDPDKWWTDKSVPQKIATIVGSALLGFGGNAQLAVNNINQQIDRSIALQQSNIDRKRVAAGHAENLYQMFLQNSKNEQEAYDKTRATLLDAAMIDATRAGLGAKSQIQSAQMDQFIAALKMQRDEILAKLKASVGGAGQQQQGAFIPLEQGATTVTLQDGTELYIGHGGEEVARNITNSERAAIEADRLSKFANPANIPNPATHPQAYQQWVGELRERLKSVSVLGAQHLGNGGGRVATMQAYRNAIAGPDNDPKGFFGAVADYPSLTAGGLAASIQNNARVFAEGVRDDMVQNIQTHNALTGHQRLVGARGTGEFKGASVAKPVFEPTGRYRPPPRPGYNQTTNQDPTARFQPGP